MGGAPNRARLLKLEPRALRDSGYRLYARWRYRAFGRQDHCALPPPEELARLLP